MKIGKNSVVAINYDILDEGGQTIEHGDAPHYYLHGGYNAIFPRVEEALTGKEQGEEVRVKLVPADGFGEHNPQLIRQEPRDRFPADVAVGMYVRAEINRGGQIIPANFRVTGVTDSSVTLDGNHPLAGRTIQFQCTVESVRAATDEEISHGHVHGPDDHHH